MSINTSYKLMLGLQKRPSQELTWLTWGDLQLRKTRGQVTDMTDMTMTAKPLGDEGDGKNHQLSGNEGEHHE